ncbi:MAG: hypothetical protein JJ899_08795 [Alphaproteobacteria bacterium]|nr:hypothetical protein [Alphaproteobacteria bacterium]
MSRPLALLALAAVILVACTHGREWSTYRIRIETEPRGADCFFERDGVITTAPEPTPVDVTMTSIGEDVGIVCTKEGYKAASTAITGGFLDNLFLRYNRHTPRRPETTVNLTLVPLESDEQSTSTLSTGTGSQRGFTLR